MSKNYVYVATCEYDGDTLVKFGITLPDRFPKRMQELKRKYNDIEHTCRACYVSIRNRDIEAELLAHFAGKGADITSREKYKYEDMESRKSQEHFKISLEEALKAFEDTIMRIDECQVNNTPCSIYEGCRSYTASDRQ